MKDIAIIIGAILLLLLVLSGFVALTYFITLFAFDVNQYLGWAAVVFFSLKWLAVLAVIGLFGLRVALD